jgi:hypothetical protein
MSLITVGHRAPNIVLNTVEGEPFNLVEALQSKQSMLLIFLRHLG